MDLEEYTQYHEAKLHNVPGFSYNTYLCTIPLDFPKVDLHWHEQMEIIYVKKGAGTVTAGRHIWPVNAGAIVPILPGELHSIERQSDQRMEYENIIFSLSLLESVDKTDWCSLHVVEPLKQDRLFFPRPIVPGTDFYQEVSAALDDADKACAARENGYSLLVRSCLFRFLHALYIHQTAAYQEQPSPHEDVIKKVIVYVREHYAEALSVSDAAALTGYSNAHFMRIFRETSGQTFVEYLNGYRLSRASYLLRESPDPVTKVAQECGFDNFSYFSRIFSKRYGVSPRRYRKNIPQGGDENSAKKSTETL